MAKVKVTVRSYELDALGHVNNAVYLNYLEFARVSFFLARGSDFRNLFAQGYSLILAESRLKFRAPAYLNDTLQIQTDLSIEGIRLIFEQSIKKIPEGLPVLTATNTLAILDKNGRPIKPNADFMSWLGDGIKKVGKKKSTRIPEMKFSVPAVLVCATVAGVSFYQATSSIRDVPSETLHRGRIILTPGEFLYAGDDPDRNGSRMNVMDGNENTAGIIPFPAPPPEGSYYLMDTALTHWPPLHQNGKPRRRIPSLLRITNGLCLNCPLSEFQKYGRIQTARIEILYRRANDPDVEYVIPPAVPQLVFRYDFPDRPGSFDIPLHLNRVLGSPAYPKNVYYIICKITVLTVYPGSVYSDRVALAEVVYGDRSDPYSSVHLWR